jgi:hypothetical protein
VIQERTQPRFTFPTTSTNTQENSSAGVDLNAGLDQWIRQHPQVAFFGAVLFGSRTRMDAEDKKVDSPGDIRPLGTNIASLVRDIARLLDLQLQLLTHWM